MKMKMKRTITFMTAGLILLTLAGCEGKTNDKTITNIDGAKINVPEKAERIAAVYGPSYEAVVALGDEDKVVVRADVQTDSLPWATKVFKRIRTLPYLKNVHTGVNTEEVLKYNPDIIFGFPRPNEIKKLEDAGVAVVPGTSTGKLSDTPDLLMVYAQALGESEVERAKAYADYFDQKMSMVKSVTEKIPEVDRPKVYYAGVDLLTTYGKYSDLPELIEAAGGQAVSKDLEAGNRSQITFEQLAAWNPDFIFIDHGGINDSSTVEKIMADTYADGRYNQISAVAHKQIYLSPSGVFYWDMGLQKILLLMQVAKILHPDAFPDLDMVKEVKAFYTQFYQYNLTDDEARKLLNRQNP